MSLQLSYDEIFKQTNPLCCVNAFKNPQLVKEKVGRQFQIISINGLHTFCITSYCQPQKFQASY